MKINKPWAMEKKRGLLLMLTFDLALDRAAMSWIGSRPLLSLYTDTENSSNSDDEGDAVHVPGHVY